jgi:glycosyltransferase involved in cell wall biosynthesis
MTKISVIIPCFNHGAYVQDAIDSVLDQTCDDFEIIVVDDGSTEELTQTVLKNLEKPKTRVIHTANQGPSAARNNGIRESCGKYILPLDADDKIEPDYLRKASELLDHDEELGIVYCQAEFFGERKGMFYLNAFSIKNMLLDSRIFCSAFFRRVDWERTGGYNPNMIYGWEDWDFWLSIIEKKRKVFMIPEVLFKCRVRRNSRTRSMSLDQKIDMHAQLFRNHQDLFVQNVRAIFEDYYDLKESRCSRWSMLKKQILYNVRNRVDQVILMIVFTLKKNCIGIVRFFYVKLPRRFRLILMKSLNNILLSKCSRR